MSTAEFGDLTLGQAPAPAPAPAPDGLLSPSNVTAPAPLEPLAQPAPLIAPPLVAPAAPLEVVPAPAVPVSDMRDVPLGTLIFRAGLLTEEQLEEALQSGMQRGKRLGEVLLEGGLVSEGDLGRLLAGQKGLRFVELDSAAIDPAAVQLLPVEKARLHSVLPIGFQDGLPVVAVADPSNDLVVENIRRALNCEPRLVVAGREALHRQIEVAYSTVRVAAPVPADAAPVAPVVPTPEPVAPPVAPPAPPVAETLEPAAVHQAEPIGDGVWLGAPETTLQPEPVVPFYAPEIQSPVAEPLPSAAAPTPAADTPDLPPPLPEPVAISFTPVAPVEQPAVEPLAPLPAAQPVFTPEPVAVPEPPVAYEPLAAPEPLVAPETVAVPEPMAVPEPVVVPDPFVTAPEPLLQQPAPEEAAADTVVTWSVVLQLNNGDRVEIGAFHSSEAAKAHAQNVVRQISSDHGWPFFGGRFISPEAIVSVDLSEPEDRWLGSAARRQAWTAGEQPS